MGRNVVKVLLTMLMAAALAVGSPGVWEAQAAPVRVSLPAFTVTLNGAAVDSAYSQYPLIVYRDITYFPMTYNDCRCLGVETQWSSQTGLTIEQTGVAAARAPYVASRRNAAQYDSAAIVSGPVKVNGKAIDNAAEEYPLLLFRDITYFPLTWRFAVDEFGWEYSFGDKHGLVIESTNAKLEQFPVPKNRLLNAYGDYEGQKSTAVMARDGFCYYVDDKGSVMQAPLSDMNNAKKVFQLEIWSYGDGKQYDHHDFYEENGRAMLYFHSGGAVMGSDHRYILKQDGAVQKIQSSYYDTTLIGDKLYMLWVGPTPGPGNLRVQDSQDVGLDTSASLDTTDYWYYSLCDTKGLPKLELIGGELYLRAARALPNQEDGYGYDLEDVAVYKVNTAGDEVAKVSRADGQVLNAQIAGEYLYYVGVKGEGDQCTYSVYRHSLKDAAETLIGDFKGMESWEIQLAVVGEQVYYVNEGSLYRLDGNAALNPDAEVISFSVTGDNREFLACTFRETPDSKYRVMVFDQFGNDVFKTSDSGSSIIVEGKTLHFYNITTETLCRTTLSD